MNQPVSDLRFWKKPTDEAIVETVVANVRRIRSDQEQREKDNLLYASLYGDVQMLGFGAYTYSRPSSKPQDQLSLNVVRNMTGAVVSRVAAKAKPKPMFLTKGGDWELSRKARRLEKAVDGTFYKVGFYEEAKLVFRDAVIFGTGVLKWGVDYDAGQVFAERVLPGELLVDDASSLYGGKAAKTYYHLRYYDPAVLAEIYPEHEEAIMALAAKSSEGEAIVGYSGTTEQILVVEAWRCPAFAGAQDGMWVRCIEGTLLEKAPYKRTYPPFSVYRWDASLAGFFGTGLAHELCGIQLSINDHLDEIEDLLRAIKGKWFVEELSRVNPNKLNDEGDGIVFYRGTAPVYVAPNVIPGEVYNHLWNLVQKAYEVAGISQLAATSQKPSGLNSGVGLRAYRDQQSERFLDKYQAWDEFVLQSARLSLDAMRDLAEWTKEPLVISARRGHVLEQIDFKDNDLEERAYELQIMPTSMLPTTPSGRLAFVEDMGRMGVAEPDELLELIEMPDTDRFVKRRLATRQLVEDIMEAIVETGEYDPPEPFMHWPTALRVAVESYLEYRRDKCPPAKLELVSRWIVQARLMQKRAAAEEAPPPAPPGPPGPPGPPMPPPGMGPPPGPGAAPPMPPPAMAA